MKFVSRKQESAMELNQIALEIIIEIINDLPLEQRVCVFFTHHDKLSVTEIAERLAVSEAEVQSRLDSGEAAIRAALDAREDEDDRIPKAIALPLILAPALKYGIDSGLLTISASGATTAAVGGTAASTATASTATTVISTKTILAAAVAGVVVICGIIAGIVIFGGDDTVPVGRDAPGTPLADGGEGDNGDNGTPDTPEVQETSEPVSIHLNNQGITDEQLAELVASGEIPANVTYLRLHHNEITNLSPLSGLTDLVILELFFNEITDISPLSGLVNLSHLYLEGNEITDLSPLGSLMGLSVLGLGGEENNDNFARLAELGALGIATWSADEDDEIKLRFFRGSVTDWSPVAHVETVHGRPAD
jgi:hypothetical protein